MCEISFQKVWHGDALKFRVRSEVLGSAAVITATNVQLPTEEIHFANNDEFGYRPGTGDLHEFTVTFRAQLHRAEHGPDAGGHYQSNRQ